jgi:hypothetical protein
MKSHHLLWILPLFLFSCGKKNPDQPKPVAFTFTTTYDSVLRCYANCPYVFSFGVNVLTGDIGANRVFFSVAGLPTEISVDEAVQSVGYVMGGSFKFTIGNMPIGYDTVALVISTATGGSQTHKLIFDVQKPIDYSPRLVGTFPHSFDFCQPDSFFYYSSVVSTIADTPYLVKISNIKNLGPAYKIRALISKVVTIPVQTVGAYTIWGSGTFSKDTGIYYQMLISDTMVKGVDTERCTIHIVH